MALLPPRAFLSPRIPRGVGQGRQMEHMRRVPLASQWMLEVWQAEYTWYWYARVVNDAGAGLLTLGPYASAAEAAGAVMMDLSKHKYGYLDAVTAHPHPEDAQPPAIVAPAPPAPWHEYGTGHLPGTSELPPVTPGLL
jgi:hypothetical protein